MRTSVSADGTEYESISSDKTTIDAIFAGVNGTDKDVVYVVTPIGFPSDCHGVFAGEVSMLGMVSEPMPLGHASCTHLPNNAAPADAGANSEMKSAGAVKFRRPAQLGTLVIAGDDAALVKSSAPLSSDQFLRTIAVGDCWSALLLMSVAVMARQ
jgi:hypothetical protein